MDPLTMILAALAAGASAGLGDAASAAVKDGYAGLKALLRAKFAGRPRAEAALDDHATDPETYEKPMAKQLLASGAVDDERILAVARALLEAAGPAASAGGKYRVDLRGAQGVQVGDGGSMTVSFQVGADRPDPVD